eukprot:CAMPEP_0117426116 /NCGR_PEP_ID=MMETSP0758-20121206/6283_1 /TAXON_ID=63605 /ORGANISM="Percolomonas cosmopolitus, Strain AE-1 (ATCC 50343)" /LENGTH=209 /DNA_ID=CAMNT_0005211069 /DNA_START=310 /DNA_END=935 /DNA_ORIENTATION=+
MMQFSVTNYSGIELNATAVQREGAKPCIIFQGDLWENDEVFSMAANLLTDFFGGERHSKISITGIDHALIFTSINETTIHMGHYGIKYSRSKDAQQGKVVQYPRIDLVDIGPSMNLEISNHKFASDDLRNEALLIPYQLRHAKGYNKNISQDELGEVYGRVHLKQQDIRDMAPRKFKSMKGSQKKKANAMEARSKTQHKLRESLDSYIA